MTDLSPAAQTVLDAANNELDHAPWDVSHLAKPTVAAVLRAVADQVVPVDYEDIHGCWYEKKNNVREQLLAIADEFEVS